jgi:hypothetical protein
VECVAVEVCCEEIAIVIAVHLTRGNNHAVREFSRENSGVIFALNSAHF